MWAFTERMGVAIGMNVTDVGYLLGVGTFFGLVGAGLAAVIGDKFGNAFPIIIATSVLTMGGFAFLKFHTYLFSLLYF